MTIALINPPSINPFAPPLGTAVLLSFLRSKGISAIQRDMSFDYLEHLINRNTILDSLKLLRERQADQLGALSSLLVDIDWDDVNNMSKAGDVLRSADFYDLKLNHHYSYLIYLAYVLYLTRFGIESLIYPTAEMTFAQWNIRSEIELIKLTSDKDRNPYFAFCKKYIDDLKINSKIDAIGVSISYEFQLISALTIAKIWKMDYGLPIYVGGPYITYSRNKLMQHPGVVELADAFVVLDGEIPLLSLLTTRKKTSYIEIPNIIFHDGKKLIRTQEAHPPAADSMPSPSFDGLKVKRYLVPEVVLPVLATRQACPYGNCAFCNSKFMYKGWLNTKSAKTLIDEMVNYDGLYGCKHFMLCDDCIPIDLLLDLSRKIIKARKRYRWSAAFRVCDSISRKDISLLKEGGLTRIQFGLESVCDRMLSLFQKGRMHSDIIRTLKYCEQTGISVFLTAFIGFPGETRSEALKTLDFFNRQIFRFESGSIYPYSHEEGSIAWRNPEDYGIIMSPDIKYGLFDDVQYKVRKGISSDQARRLLLRKDRPRIHSPVIGSAATLLYLARMGYKEFKRKTVSLRKEGSPLIGWG